MRLLLLALLLALATPSWAQSVYVANQGNFSEGNGSVTAIPAFFGGDVPRGDAEQLFVGGLGSILQSVTQIDDRLYLVANSANRVDVVDEQTNGRIGQLGGTYSSPRYLEPVLDGTGKAYVTNQVYSGEPSYVLPVDLATEEAGTPIPVDGLPEAVVVAPGFDKAYVALGTFGPGSGVDSVAVIDTRADALLRYVDIGCFARFVAASQADGAVLAFCEDTDEAVVIDPATDTVVQRLAFGEDIGAPSLGQSVGPGTFVILTRRSGPPSITFLVVTASGIAEVGGDLTGGFAVERTVAVPDADTRPISAVAGGLGVLLLGRPDPDNPFTAAGTITVHDPNDGSLLATYPAGVFPTHIAIDERFGVATEGTPEDGGLTVALAGPNPTRGATALSVTLAEPAAVRVDVIDGLGRTVRVVEAAFGAGPQRVALDLGGLAPGAYLARVTAGDAAATVALSVVR